MEDRAGCNRKSRERSEGDPMNPVQTFLRNHYSDARLVELLADCQSGKFSFISCCCFIGRPTATHEAKGDTGIPDCWDAHLDLARQLVGADEAESFLMNFDDDVSRHAYLIPLIEAEIAYRGANHVEADSDLVYVAGNHDCGSVADCRHADRNEAMTCIFYRANKTDQVGKFHGPNHFELSQVSA